ncbi:MAG: hypothetical protein LBK58_00960 [Prevotellaceae bacterium]|jgi:hypothetical protein|nr:hypothetical protein [Prevotellaceae bacterium]
MKKYLKQMQSHAGYGKSAVETGDHSRNGASPKSLMSRGNELINFVFLLKSIFLTAVFVLCVCSILQARDDCYEVRDGNKVLFRGTQKECFLFGMKKIDKVKNDVAAVEQELQIQRQHKIVPCGGKTQSRTPNSPTVGGAPQGSVTYPNRTGTTTSRTGRPYVNDALAEASNTIAENFGSLAKQYADINAQGIRINDEKMMTANSEYNQGRQKINDIHNKQQQNISGGFNRFNPGSIETANVSGGFGFRSSATGAEAAGTETNSNMFGNMFFDKKILSKIFKNCNFEPNILDKSTYEQLLTQLQQLANNLDPLISEYMEEQSINSLAEEFRNATNHAGMSAKYKSANGAQEQKTDDADLASIYEKYISVNKARKQEKENRRKKGPAQVFIVPESDMNMSLAKNYAMPNKKIDRKSKKYAPDLRGMCDDTGYKIYIAKEWVETASVGEIVSTLAEESFHTHQIYEIKSWRGINPKPEHVKKMEKSYDTWKEMEEKRGVKMLNGQWDEKARREYGNEYINLPNESSAKQFASVISKLSYYKFKK